MFKHTLIALVALQAGLAAFGATGAQAFPAGPQPAAETGGNSLLLDVRDRYPNHMMWDRHRHGDRCHGFTNHCRHYYNGYWYENPWWVVPFAGAGIALGANNHGHYGRRHVAWCLDHYRSYDPRTNTWVSYSGRVHQCISPYGP